MKVPWARPASRPSRSVIVASDRTIRRPTFAVLPSQTTVPESAVSGRWKSTLRRTVRVTEPSPIQDWAAMPAAESARIA